MNRKRIHIQVCILFIPYLLSINLLNAQETLLEQTIVLDKTTARITDILFEMSKQGITFSYKEDLTSEDKIITLPKKTMTVKEVLDILAREGNLSYKVYKKHIIIRAREKRYNKVSGFIYGKQSGEPLVAANVYNPNTFEGVISNNYGFYSFSLPVGSSTIRYSYISYQSVELLLNPANDTVINIHLMPNTTLEEVTIEEKSDAHITSSLMSNHTLTLQSIEQQPHLLGENDVLKTIQLLPGIQTLVEGSTGLCVRGGSHSHNLILIDDVPVYNVDHFFGFFSIFNPDAIKRVTFYKGAFPARYGERVSSILDVRMNEGNNDHFQYSYSIGLLGSKIKIETPILKNKTGFMVSARRTYMDLPLIINNMISSDNSKEGYGFSDIYTKVNHTFSERSRLYVSFFYGIDKYKKEDETEISTTGITTINKNKIGWKNYAIATRLNYLISDALFCNTTLTFSGYKYSDKQQEMEEFIDAGQRRQNDITKFDYYSGIKDAGIKIDFDLPVSKKHYFRFGTGGAMHIYQPFIEGRLIMIRENTDNPFYLPTFYISYDTLWNNGNIKSYTMSGYVEDDISLTPKLKTNIGFRYNTYYFKKKIYHSPEPRISARYMILPTLAIKAGYARMSQSTHLLSNSFLVLPFDVWMPSTSRVKPLYSDHYTLSCNFTLLKDLETTVEGFYRTIQNDIIYNREGEIDMPALSWEDYIEQGFRRSFGLEVMLQKQTGNFTGWLTYTLSKAERKFSNINKGEYYPFCLVRKHRLSASLNKKINKNIGIGVIWLYSSGVKPASGYCELSPVVYQGGTIYSIPGLSPSDSWSLTHKIPAYHRMDASMNFYKQKKKGQRIFSIGLYNAYARNNPFLISEAEGFLYLSRIQMVIPFFQYSYKFM